jgi:pSer/pThr/pTyr-binding forkhead associated (FHA) protein
MAATAPSNGDGDAFVEHAPTRAAAPGTLAMLPGRLEVVAGEARGHDIRFVRTTANGEQQVTIGRGEGPPYEHVQLRAPTVSRRHACLCYREGQWSITNLSSTNPLLVNGVPLTTGGSARPLDDGDMIEMGEVVFRFRDH